MDAEKLNSCLRSELASVETYQQVIEKHRKDYSTEAGFGTLTRIQSQHQDAASKLRSLIQQKHGKPTDDSGAWGTWSQTITGAAKIFGDKAALKALKEGEESGLKEYRSFIDDTSTPADVRNVLAPLMARQQEHIRELDRLMDAA
jgi:uncharacterized protein (TIGR02284 family)